MPYLQESVQSVLAQSFAHFEFLILDDCSTDKSREYIESIKDSRIRFYKNEKNKGLFYNLNYLIQQSASPLIKLWSQDDIMSATTLQDVVAFHAKHPDVGFSYTAVKYINEHSELVRDAKEDPTPEIVDSETHARICFYTGSIAGNIANVTVTKAAIDKVGLFNEQMIISGDFDMWVRVAEYYPIGFLNKPLVMLRNHDGQLSRQAKYYIKHIEEDAVAYKRLFGYIPGHLKTYGRQELRKHKLVFYYTLMMHSFLKGHIRDGFGFWKAISKLDSPVIMFPYFLKSKLSSRPKEREYLKL